MPVEVPPVPPSGSSTAPTSSEEKSFEERWAAWQAKGDAQELAFRRKMAVAAPCLIVVAIAIGYAFVGR